MTVLHTRTCPCGGRVDIVSVPTTPEAHASAGLTSIGACERCGTWFDEDELLELPRGIEPSPEEDLHD